MNDWEGARFSLAVSLCPPPPPNPGRAPRPTMPFPCAIPPCAHLVCGACARGCACSLSRSVHASWAAYFTALKSGAHPSDAVVAPPAVDASGRVVGPALPSATAASGGPGGYFNQRVMHLTRAYQVRGHERASLDPLGTTDRLGGAVRQNSRHPARTLSPARTYDLAPTHPRPSPATPAAPCAHDCIVVRGVCVLPMWRNEWRAGRPALYHL